MYTLKQIRKLLTIIQKEITIFREKEKTIHNRYKPKTDFERGYYYGRLSACKDIRKLVGEHINGMEYEMTNISDRDTKKK